MYMGFIVIRAIFYMLACVGGIMCLFTEKNKGFRSLGFALMILFGALATYPQLLFYVGIAK